MGILIKNPSMKNELDLRKKIEPRIIERIVFQRRPWHMEALKLIIAVLVATGAVYAISKADEMPSFPTNDNPTKSFSVIGFISNVADGRISIERANGSDGRTNDSYSFGLATVSKIETSEYVTLPATLLRVGDQIIVQGTETDGVVTPTRIVSFAQISADDIAIVRLAEVMLVSSTPDVAIAAEISTSTNAVATSTPSASGSSQGSSEGVTPEEGALFASTTPVVTIVGEASTSTGAVATSTEPVATSSEPVLVPADSAATSTESISTSTAPVMTPVAPSIPTETVPAQVPVETAPEPTVISEPVVEPVAAVVE
jgi:hypothetical protein